MRVLGSHRETQSPPVAILGISVVFLIVVWNRLVPRLPGYIVALVGGTLAAAIIDLRVDTIGSRFGGIPAGLSSLEVPAVWRASRDWGNRADCDQPCCNAFDDSALCRAACGRGADGGARRDSAGRLLQHGRMA
jgi:hypothetical protein